jgi:hypothetical protein
MTPTALPTDATGEHSTTERASDDASVSTLMTDAGDRVSDAVDALRATADQVGDRIPVVIDTVRDGALESARTIKALPESGQRLLAAFSLGLGLGLSISGAPRLLVAATLAPAMFVAAVIVSRDPTTVGEA